ncbi:hypothetical protein CHELA40_11484 [Chelatococcus asaccharovorans]|nr:hypothetical protein CHELA40_11484 [Chelatococcus asaccharovorans]
MPYRRDDFGPSTLFTPYWCPLFVAEGEQMIADNQIWIERFTPFGRQWHVMQSTCDSVPHAWPFRICPLDRSLRLMLLTLRT